MTDENSSSNSMTDENSSSNLLARIDERTKTMALDISDLKARFVTMDRFRTVEMLAYGLAGLMLTAMVLGIIYVVIPHGG